MVELTKQQVIEANCLGTSPPYAGTDGASLAAVSAGGCMIAPHGCTMNFIFTDGVRSTSGRPATASRVARTS